MFDDVAFTQLFEYNRMIQTCFYQVLIHFHRVVTKYKFLRIETTFYELGASNSLCFLSRVGS